MYEIRTGARSGRSVLLDKHSDQCLGYKMKMMKSLPARSKAQHHNHVAYT